MRALAEGLGLPTNASREDLVQMVCGKLTDEGRQPSNIQLVVEERQLKLRDVDGVFLELDTEDASDESPLGAEEGETISQSAEDQCREDLVRVMAERDDLQAPLVEQQGEVQPQKERYTQLWRMNCEPLGEFDKTLGDKDEQIKTLLERIALLEAGMRPPAALAPLPTVSTPPTNASLAGTGSRRGKAPPVDPFSGDQQELTFDDWLPRLEGAAEWNG